MKKLMILLTISFTLALGGCEKEDDIEILNQENGELTLEDLVGTWVTVEAEFVTTGDVYHLDEDDPCFTVSYPEEVDDNSIGVVPFYILEISHSDGIHYNFNYVYECVSEEINFITSNVDDDITECYYNNETLYFNGKSSGLRVRLENNTLYFEPTDTTNPKNMIYTFKKQK